MHDSSAAEVVQWLRALPGALFAVLDNARDSHIHDIVTASGAEHQALLEGGDPAVNEHYGPLLVALESAPLLETLVRDGWGNSWGIYVSSGARFRHVAEQLQNVFAARTVADDRELVFRFYDPRVARVFLPEAGPRQQAMLFDEVSHYTMEDETGDRLLCFTRSKSRVEQTRIELGTKPTAG